MLSDEKGKKKDLILILQTFNNLLYKPYRTFT